MNFELSLYSVLVFVVPGCMIECGVALLTPGGTTRLLHAFEQPTANDGLLFLSMAFVLGALTDSFRTLAIDPLLRRLTRVRFPDYLHKLTARSLPVYEFIFQRTHEYYRFNSNVAVGAFVLGVSGAYASSWWFACTFGLSLSCATLAGRQQRELAAILAKLQ